ncbi:MAG: S-adenosylhomocysteine hydrolase [Ferrimicrobium sp.]
MRRSKIREGIRNYMDSRPDEAAFLRSEFEGCGGTRSGVDKAIRGMVQDGELVRVGYGAYVRARRMISPVTKEPMIGAIVVPEVWAWQTLRKLGVDPQPNSALRDYNEGRSTQIPVWLAFDVGRSRIRRKIRLGKRELIYERSR